MKTGLMVFTCLYVAMQSSNAQTPVVPAPATVVPAQATVVPAPATNGTGNGTGNHTKTHYPPEDSPYDVINVLLALFVPCLFVSCAYGIVWLEETISTGKEYDKSTTTKTLTKSSTPGGETDVGRLEDVSGTSDKMSDKSNKSAASGKSKKSAASGKSKKSAATGKSHKSAERKKDDFTVQIKS